MTKREHSKSGGKALLRAAEGQLLPPISPLLKQSIVASGGGEKSPATKPSTVPITKPAHVPRRGGYRLPPPPPPKKS